MTNTQEELTLSIIMPTYNEKNIISDCIDSILANNFDGINYELIVADGMSTDGTREILEDYKKKNNNIVLLDNIDRFQVNALNMMLEIAKGEYIIRCDAHSIYPDNYFKVLIGYLIKDPKIGNVGCHIKTENDAKSLIAKSIRDAMSSTIGVGLSHRTIKRNTPVEVDTVLFGAWKREIFKEVGNFDLNFVRGQDYEHNCRIRLSGKSILLIPDTNLIYYTRTTYKGALKKIFQYAAAKVQIAKKHKWKYISFRALAPLTLHVIILSSIFVDKDLFFSLLAIYVLLTIYFGIKEKKISNIIGLFLFPFSVISLHISHSLGVVYGIFNYILRGKNKISWEGTRA